MCIFHLIILEAVFRDMYRYSSFSLQTTEPDWANLGKNTIYWKNMGVAHRTEEAAEQPGPKKDSNLVAQEMQQQEMQAAGTKGQRFRDAILRRNQLQPFYFL